MMLTEELHPLVQVMMRREDLDQPFQVMEDLVFTKDPVHQPMTHKEDPLDQPTTHKEGLVDQVTIHKDMMHKEGLLLVDLVMIHTEDLAVDPVMICNVDRLMMHAEDRTPTPLMMDREGPSMMHVYLGTRCIEEAVLSHPKAILGHKGRRTMLLLRQLVMVGVVIREHSRLHHRQQMVTTLRADKQLAVLLME